MSRRRNVSGLLVFACASGAVLGWPVYRHDLAMARLTREVAALSLPPGVEITASESAFGLLWCCSNHCDARVLARLEGPATPEAVRAAVAAGPGFSGAFSATASWQLLAIDGPQVYEVEANTRAPAQLDPADEPAIRAFVAPELGSPQLVLAVRDQSFDAFDLWDPRCH